MSLYKRKDSPYWWFSFRTKAGRVYKSTGTINRRRAERICAQSLTEIEEGRWFDKAEQISRSFGDLCDRYIADFAPKLKDKRRPIDIITKHLLPFFGRNSQLAQIVDLVGGYEKHRAGITSETLLRELGVLRRMFNLAKKWRWCSENPVELIELPTVDSTHVRYLDPAEVTRLELHAQKWLRNVIIFARQTGLRRGSMLNLTWSMVDFERRALNIPGHLLKSGRPLGLPLTDAALVVLRKQGRVRHLSSPWVFCDEQGNQRSGGAVSLAFRRLCKTAKVERMRFHDLRHDFASCLVQAGVDLNVVRELLGHKDMRTTLRYAHLAPENLREGIAVLDRLRSGYDIKKRSGE